MGVRVCDRHVTALKVTNEVTEPTGVAIAANTKTRM